MADAGAWCSPWAMAVIAKTINRSEVAGDPFEFRVLLKAALPPSQKTSTSVAPRRPAPSG